MKYFNSIIININCDIIISKLFDLIIININSNIINRKRFNAIIIQILILYYFLEEISSHYNKFRFKYYYFEERFHFKLFDIDLNIIILMKELITYIYVRKYIWKVPVLYYQKFIYLLFFLFFFSLRDSFLNLKFPVLHFEDLSPENKCRFYIQGCYCFRERFNCFYGFELNCVFYFFFVILILV